MRKTTILMCVIVLISASFIAFGCGNGESAESPEEVARQYMEASKKLDVDAAYALLSKESQGAISLEEMRAMTEAYTDEIDFSYQIGKTTINGDAATVEVTVIVEGEELTDQLDLVKEGGAWKVSLGF